VSPKQPARRRAREYPIDRETPRALDLHLIADNYATHKKVQTWLTQHPCFPMHFTPTSSSWLNLVERFFADLTLCVRIGNFASVNELVRDIKSDLAEYNADRARAMALMPGSSFTEPVAAADARHLRALLDTATMDRCPDIGFDSYDRFLSERGHDACGRVRQSDCAAASEQT
jgi:transposase